MLVLARRQIPQECARLGDDGDGVLCPTALWGGNVGKKRVQFLPVKE